MGRRQNSAIDRSELARAAKPLGELIAGIARTRDNVGGGPPPPVIVSKAPGQKKKKRTSKKDRESTVLRDCLKLLHTSGIFAWRNNTGTLWAGGQPVSFGYPGSPDIIGILDNGRFLGVECKSATGRQSDKQKDFERAVESRRGVYILVRSAKDLQADLHARGY